MKNENELELKPKMKIGLYGGSFNPVHNGHIDIITHAINRGLVDEVWIMPCKNHVFNKDLASIDDRIDMLNLAINSKNITDVRDIRKHIRIEDLEARSNSKSRTATSLRKLRGEYPDNEFYFIIGSDALNEIDRWYDSEYLKRTTPFIVVKREGYDFVNRSDLKLKGIIKELSDISSTDIRERISCNESIKGMVPETIERYILKKELYKNTVKYENPASTVDLIVPIDSGILFVKRKHAPFKGYWAFPGGYLECGKESLEKAGVRELFEETSLKVKPKDLELLGVYSDPNRDPRGHVIDHAYVVKKFTGKMKANDDAAEVQVFKNKPEKLAFDHSKIYDDYLKKKGRDY